MSSQDTSVNKIDENDESSSSTLSTSPNTVCVLDAPMNGKVYVVGTAHFSVESQKEVAELIRKVQPDRVVLELCEARVNILTLDEETVLKQAKEMDMDKVLKLMKETSVAHGLLQSLLIRLYAQVTEELGLAPGGEFRAAYKEAMKVPGCKVVLGDMPISLTLGRGFYSLPWYRKLRLGWCLLTTNSKITKEDIEELKKSDMLDTLLKEFGSTFPEFKRVLIDERDMYLTNSLRNAYQPIVQDHTPGQPLKPATVVGVVGLGHVSGIKNNWNKFIDMAEITKNPRDNKSSNSLKYAKWSIVLGTAAVIGYKIWKRRFV